MNLKPIYPLPRPGFADNLPCIRCGRPGAMVADLDGEPFKEYYHDVCVPAEYQEAVRRLLIKASAHDPA